MRHDVECFCFGGLVGSLTMVIFFGVTMKLESQSVKSRDKNSGDTVEIGQANFPVYDSVAEGVEHEGEEKCLEFVNAQVRTNEMNRVRALARGGPSKNKLKQLAIAEIAPETWQEIAGDIAAIDKVISEKIEEISARMAASAPTAVAIEDD